MFLQPGGFDYIWLVNWLQAIVNETPLFFTFIRLQAKTFLLLYVNLNDGTISGSIIQLVATETIVIIDFICLKYAHALLIQLKIYIKLVYLFKTMCKLHQGYPCLQQKVVK